MDETRRSNTAIAEVLAARQGLPGALLPVLHDLQDRLGHVPPDAVPAIARALNLSRAEVHGVVTFYHHFRSKPAGRHVLRICRAESWQALGSDALAAHGVELLGAQFGETTCDGKVTLENVYCLGNCACSPAVVIDDDIHGRVTPERLSVLLRARMEVL